MTEVQDIAKEYRDAGFNIIPIQPNTKVPPTGASVDNWKVYKCDVEIEAESSIAMLHGKLGGTWASDFDDPTILEDVIEDKKRMKDLLIIKTPKKGHHIIWRWVEDDFPPSDTKFTDKKGRTIDIKAKGYTLFPPSSHDTANLGRYQFLNKTLQPAKIKWSNFLNVINAKGFFSKTEVAEKGTFTKKYHYLDLIRGKFVRGTRRQKQKSYYIQYRTINDKSHEEAVKSVEKINATCIPPIEEPEFSANMRSIERYYEDVVIPSRSSSFGNSNVVVDKSTTDTEKLQKQTINAYVMADAMMTEYNFVSHISKEIYYYSDGIYREGGDKLIHQKCRQFWEEVQIQTKHINEIENIIRDRTMVLQKDETTNAIFNLDHKKQILKNGMFNFDTMELEKYDPQVLSTIKYPIYYDDTAECPRFDKFLDSCFDGDEKSITIIWEMMALCMVNKILKQKGYVLYGIGANGKSTFLSILRSILGIQNISSIAMQSFQKDQFKGFELHGKVANLSGDGGTEPIEKTGFIKETLGGDAIRCEQKYHDTFVYSPFVTLVFTFNELPAVNDSSDGFARKIQTIHFAKQFYGTDRDDTVEDIANSDVEKSGIYNKLIPIMKRLIEGGKLTYDNSAEETRTIWSSRSDSFFSFKLHEMVKGADYSIGATPLYQLYTRHCQTEGLTAISQRQFSAKVSEYLGGVKNVVSRDEDGNSLRIWQGVTVRGRLRDDNQESLDETENERDGKQDDTQDDKQDNTQDDIKNNTEDKKSGPLNDNNSTQYAFESDDD